VLSGLPSGYNRELQEIKEPFMDGLSLTRGCLDITARLVDGLRADARALRAAFTAGVFATDRALELVARGMPFREAYGQVKANLDALDALDPAAAVAAKTHLGGPAGLDLAGFRARAREITGFVRDEERQFLRVVSRLLGVRYPQLDSKPKRAPKGASRGTT
jgi:argininosuccinate lyase